MHEFDVTFIVGLDEGLEQNESSSNKRLSELIYTNQKKKK